MRDIHKLTDLKCKVFINPWVERRDGDGNVFSLSHHQKMTDFNFNIV